MILIKEENFFKDERLGFVECRHTKSSSHSFKPHMHTRFSVGGMERGEVIYQVGGQEAILSKGALAVINPETLHSCNAIDGASRSYYMLYLDTGWCFNIQRELWGVCEFLPVQQSHLEDDKIYNQYCCTLKALMAKDVDLLEKEQRLYNLISEVLAFSCSMEFHHSKEGGSFLHVQFLKDKLGSNLKDDLTLDLLATELNENSYTLLRRFKRETGITPHAYRMNCRIEQARQMLQDGVDIAETALECGFFDQSHLHRHFKAMTTVTPYEYQVNFIQ